MYSNAYDEIEKEIKQTDFYMRESFLIDVLYISFIIAVSCFIWVVAIYENLWWIILIVFFIFVFIGYFVHFKIICDIAHNIHSENPQSIQELHWTQFFKFKAVWNLSKKIRDIKLSIKDIIKKYGITTKGGLEETISHYRFKAITASRSYIDLLSFLALAASIASFILNHSSLPQKTVIFIFTLILILIFAYISILSIGKGLFKKYGSKAFYTRIENSLSEILALNKFSTRGRKAKTENIE